MIIDLSMVVDEDSVVFPGDAKPKFEKAGTMATTNFVDHVIHVNNHLGTHIDLPGHMVEGGKKLLDYPVDRYIKQAICIDARGKQLDSNLLNNIELIEDTAVLIYTGSGDYYTQQSYATKYPEFQQSLAEKLIEAHVSMVGVDMISFDQDAPFSIHKMLLGKEVILIENLTNLEKVVSKHFKIYAMPIKFDLEAAPARVIAEVMDK